jgi:hypothetical protein
VAAAALLLLAPARAQPPAQGTVQAAYDLLERMIPGSSSHFALVIAPTPPGCPAGRSCFLLADNDAQVSVVGTSAAELTAGIGHYFREFCNFTIGWPRGGGSNVFAPAAWPSIGATPVVVARVVPLSYVMNVCTHSYSLVWYDWPAWEKFIDWMALSGINVFLAMTGQEEVQYKVFQQFGLDDLTIRTWFNGPSFLTWSRGQNEYGNNIAGPLPRSWMQAQWALQKQILARHRSLGMISELPGFQGNVPWPLAALQNDSNITQQGDTGWMYSTDPLFAKIADAWMAQLCADFGCTDHWYQLDGYFDGGTAPWLTQGVGAPGSKGALAAAKAQGRTQRRAGSQQEPARAVIAPPAGLPACTWSALLPNSYVAGCAQGCKSFASAVDAQAACAADATCGGLTSQANGVGPWELREGTSAQASPSGEAAYVITNAVACHGVPPIVPDPMWMIRGKAAYDGLARTDPEAIWSFQGWAIIGWNQHDQGESFRGFVDAIPQGKFVVIDMSTDGTGEWEQWQNASLFGAPFIWTTLHDFGGTDGLKGDLARVNKLPFTGLPPLGNTTVIGTGMTPEGIDQNPVYYEFVMKNNMRDSGMVADIAGDVVLRSHRRYGLTQPNAAVTQAWSLLVNSSYAQDLSVQDGTGIPHFPGGSSQFEADRRTPTPRLCLVWQAWGQLLAAAPAVDPSLETFRYDLVNTGRELLAQLSTPASQNFSDAIHAAAPLDPARITQSGQFYIDLLADVDQLVATESAFLLGPFIAAARAWAGNASDCFVDDAQHPIDCGDFYEYNARTQLTTWIPTKATDRVKPDGPDDYASKHWSGLIKDYYRARAVGYLDQALVDASAGRALNTSATELMMAQLAYNFQLQSFGVEYPTQPVGDFVAISTVMRSKYSSWYASC